MCDSIKQDKFTTYLKYSKWVISNISSEIIDLDTYIQETAKDLIQKFQRIAEKTIKQDKTSQKIEEQNKTTIIIAGKSFTYKDATIELKRLTDSLVEDGA